MVEKFRGYLKIMRFSWVSFLEPLICFKVKIVNFLFSARMKSYIKKKSLIRLCTQILKKRSAFNKIFQLVHFISWQIICSDSIQDYFVSLQAKYENFYKFISVLKWHNWRKEINLELRFYRDKVSLLYKFVEPHCFNTPLTVTSAKHFKTFVDVRLFVVFPAKT